MVAASWHSHVRGGVSAFLECRGHPRSPWVDEANSVPQTAGMDNWIVVESAADLREVLGPVAQRTATKERRRLQLLDRQWIAASPVVFVATCDADGNCDLSPKGDPAGFVHVIDDETIALPERPGNRRADGFHNVLANPHVGLLFVIPGRGDTLRVNGRAKVLREAPFFDELVVKGHRPELALLVQIDEVFFHCSKAFLRSKTWNPETWDPEVVPSRAEIAKTVERPDETLEELQHYYGPRYADKLYG